jgi:GTP cyclohydrolase II
MHMAADSNNPTVRARLSMPLKFARGGGASDALPPDMVTFAGLTDEREHIALVFRGKDRSVPIVRIHSECLTGDAFGSMRCDCGEQLHEALELFSQAGGILLYLRQEGRSIGLYNKMDAYKLQEGGLDTYEANRQLGFPSDARNYRAAADMLTALKVRKIELLSNNPDKQTQLESFGIVVNRRIPTRIHRTRVNSAYLDAKSGHGHSIAAK